MAHIALLDEIGDRTDRLLDRHTRIEPRRAVNVDVVGAEPLQAVGDKVLHCGRPGVETAKGAIRSAKRAELHAQDRLLPQPAAQGAAYQHLVVAHAVEIAGVEKRDPGVERRMDRRDALAFIRRAVEVAHAHAAEADGRNLGSRFPKLSLLHVSLLRLATVEHGNCATAVQSRTLRFAILLGNRCRSIAFWVSIPGSRAWDGASSRSMVPGSCTS